MNKKIIYLLIILTSSLFSQNLDSLYNSYMQIKNSPDDDQLTGRVVPSKCGFGLKSLIEENLENFSQLQKENIIRLDDRPNLHTSIVSESGYFRIHYDTAGTNMPKYDGLDLLTCVTEVALAFDSSYAFEIEKLQYEIPPSDDLNGGDERYDVYIKNIGSYGYTEPEVFLDNGTSTSFIVMDNDFGSGFATNGLAAARVTAAHEFHHAIQFGSYGFRIGEDRYYYELTSTAFEEFVYDDVNDYYFYMHNYFKNTDRQFTSSRNGSNDGYDLAVWNIFLKERFEDENPALGYDIIKRSWELIGPPNDYRAIIAIASAIQELSGYSFSTLFNEFGDWIYFTNQNFNSTDFFEEGINYPSVKTNFKYDLSNTNSVNLETKSTSLNYVLFTDFSQGFSDSIIAVISNSDVNGATGSNKTIDIEYTLSDAMFENGIPINDNYYFRFRGNNTEFVQSSFIINNVLADNITPRKEISFVYPQPFNYTVNNFLFFPTHPDLSNSTNLNIYSSDMNLIYSGKQPIYSNGNIVAPWNGIDNNGNKLASGVYVFVTEADGKIKKGKFVILQ